MLGLPDTVRACLFDLDGVLTDTASVHKKAWKAMFDAYLRDAGGTNRTNRSSPFDVDADYLTYIDGKKREDGVRSFLAARGITLPDGDPDDDPSTETVHGLGNRKNELFHQTIREDGVKVFEGSRRYLEAVAAAGLAVAVVSSSANTREVLEVTGLDKFVQQRVDGVTMRQEDIAGKPAPDSFLRAAELLGRRTRSRRLSSRTRWPVSRRAGAGTSASWSASIASATQKHCATTAPTSS